MNARIGACLAVLLFFGQAVAVAQVSRADRSFYVKPRIGAAFYSGVSDLYSLDAGMSLGAELGYQFNPYFSISGAYRYVHASGTLNALSDEAIAGGSFDASTHMVEVLLNFYLQRTSSPITPYIYTGLGLNTGGTFAGRDRHLGPLLGIGFDLGLGEHAFLFVEATSTASVLDLSRGGSTVLDDGQGPDDPLPATEGLSKYNLLSTLSLGVKYKLAPRSASDKILYVAIDGPTVLEVGQEANFYAEVQTGRSGGPIRYKWTFGDGHEAFDSWAQHRFAEPGTYRVRFEAENKHGLDSETLTVVVLEPPTPAYIVSVDLADEAPKAHDVIRFESEVRGDAQIACTWLFGDGHSATGSSPSHVFTAPGTYTVTLIATNNFGTDKRTLHITVKPR